MDLDNKSDEEKVEIKDDNPISLLKNPQKYNIVYAQTLTCASVQIKDQNYDEAARLLIKCLDMLDLGKSIMKDHGKYEKLCIYVNLACAYQGTWKMNKCNRYCEKIKEEVRELLSQIILRQQKLNLTKFLIKISFQHCAILSQINQHQKSLTICKSTIPILKQYIQQMLEYTQSLMTNKDKKKSSEIVHFSQQVFSFAEEILKNLLKYIDKPFTEDNQKKSFYYWQKNPQNNEDQIKKRFLKQHKNCKRSILGVNKSLHWIDEFNIGSIMHMNEVNKSKFQKYLPLEEYIFKDKLYQVVIYCSVAHFTIATQLRFIDIDKDRDKENCEIGHKINPITNLDYINKRYGYQQKSEMFKLSQLYHLRAINIISQNIKTTIPYISHIIKSFEKHYIYKKQLQPINSIPQQSAISASDLNVIRSKYEKNSQECQEQNYYTCNQKINKQQKTQKFIVSHIPQETSKESRSVKKRQRSQVQDLKKFGHILSEKKKNLSLEKCKKTNLQKQKKNKTKVKHQHKKKRKQIVSEKEVRIKHSSCTHINLFFKKKK